MAKNLVIVESPAKAKTIEGYLGKDYTVKSSFGHVRDLVKNGKAIDVDNNFEPKYEVSPDKKTLVSELKKLVKEAQTVWLATDEDREGEAISWHLYETLDLQKKDTKRITFNEITKAAILNAIQNPRTINQELVDAQQARRILDRLVGFELSPVLWKKVRPNLSAGRVQSVAVRLIVEKEKEIDAFQTSSFYKVNGLFGVTNGVLKADLNKNLDSDSEVNDILNKCKGATFNISSVDKKPSIRKPVAPFTTSTLQQEASLKLGFSVSRTMSVAQKLYESGKITYMRTDSVNLSDTAIEAAKNEIVNSWGPQYSNPQKYKTKSVGAQEAHEAIRPTDFGVHSITGDFDEQRLYSLIWKRAISSQMSDALLERTTIKIESPSIDEYFQSKGEVITFDGFLKVYTESSVDDEEEEENGLLPMVNINEEAIVNNITSTQRFTRPPSRYVEASLVKELEKRGIGRPSTYAPTISTIQKRGYVEKNERDGLTREYKQWILSGDEVLEKTLTEVTGKESNKLSPSDIGIVVTEFLSKHFDNIMDYNFTAEVESQFDEIANGSIKWTKMMGDFYTPFHKSVVETTENSERASGERLLGIDPKSGRKVLVRIGKFGPMVQIGKEDEDGEKSKFAGLRKTQSITSITLDEALELFKLPRVLGEYDGKEVKANVGRFGPYVQLGTLFVSIKSGDDPMDIELERAVELIKQKQIDDANKIIKVFDDRNDIQILNGRWGAYLKVGKDNYKIPKDKKAEDLTLDECLEIMGNQPQKKKTFKKKK